MSRVLAKPFAETSTRTCLYCAASMRLMEECAVSEQYTRQAWWKCTGCGRVRYDNA
jgi:uncharacterized protein with PIN domain